MAAKSKKDNFEQSYSKLSNIVEKLEDSQTTLDDALALYKEGVNLALDLNEKLVLVEKEVMVLKEKSKGIFVLKNFGESALEEDNFE